MNSHEFENMEEIENFIESEVEKRLNEKQKNSKAWKAIVKIPILPIIAFFKWGYDTFFSSGNTFGGK